MSSAACVEECLLFPLSSPSPEASKGGGPTQGVWRAHRHSPMGGELADAQTTQLCLGRRSTFLICFCTLGMGFERRHEADSLHSACSFVLIFINMSAKNYITIYLSKLKKAGECWFLFRVAAFAAPRSCGPYHADCLAFTFLGGSTEALTSSVSLLSYSSA